MHHWFILLAVLAFYLDIFSNNESPPVLQKPENHVLSCKSPTPANEIYQNSISIRKSRDYKIYSIAPKYPKKALKKQIEGNVGISFTITPAGEVINPEIISATPEGYFEDEAIRIVQCWHFKALSESKKGKTVKVKQKINFKLNPNSDGNYNNNVNQKSKI
ncbi:MAG: energy transducer TonB [Desulfobacter sp.]|nr:MAG: energy transducer TonB [Desulfobacter sp.]